MNNQVVVVGSANLDLVARSSRLPGPGETVIGFNFFESCGGKGLNQAIGAARSNARTAFIGAVGKDHAGQVLRDVLIENKVDTSGLVTHDGPTGRALIGVGDEGENSIIVVPGANHLLNISDIEGQTPILKTASVLLTQLEVRPEVVGRALQLAGERTVKILNPAPAIQLVQEFLSLVDIITPNQHEVGLLGGVGFLLDSGVKTVVLTEGSKGARVFTRTKEVQIPAFPVRPLDTTGAGDSFCGVLAARLALGETLAAALQAAVIGGALATTQEGAVASLPYWEAIAAKLESK